MIQLISKAHLHGLQRRVKSLRKAGVALIHSNGEIEIATGCAEVFGQSVG
jgi:hypothetical protein